MGAADVRTRVARVGSLTATAALAALTAACSTAPSTSAGAFGRSRVIEVVAAENMWGSIAAQLGGDRVHVTDIIDSPAADPHDYEPTAADGRDIASADVVLANGIGYDTWATQLAAANPNPARIDLTVGDVLGVADDSNPHRWYDPAAVQQVAGHLTTAYQRLDPADAAYFAAQAARFAGPATAAYRRVVHDIRTRYAGTAVGASESIVAMAVPALGLDLVTPTGFLQAVSEGTDPTAADNATIDEQIRSRAIKVYVYNAQNATPDIQRQVDEARSAGIPVTAITETLVPPTVTWQQWQTEQLVALQAALAKATGR